MPNTNINQQNQTPYSLIFLVLIALSLPNHIYPCTDCSVSCSWDQLYNKLNCSENFYSNFTSVEKLQCEIQDDREIVLNGINFNTNVLDEKNSHSCIFALVDDQCQNLLIGGLYEEKYFIQVVQGRKYLMDFLPEIALNPTCKYDLEDFIKGNMDRFTNTYYRWYKARNSPNVTDMNFKSGDIENE